jgi:hypothetical protein
MKYSKCKTSWLAWLLNRQEKEDYVIRLYKEDRSIREIAELVLIQEQVRRNKRELRLCYLLKE